MSRILVSSGSPYERSVGFSRAVRAGNLVFISGTAAIGPDGQLVAAGDPAGQARRCFEIIEAALAEAGASLSDVVRTRTMLRNIDDWEAVARVRAEFFADIRPADTIVAETRFIDPQWLVEIEAEAVMED